MRRIRSSFLICMLLAFLGALVVAGCGGSSGTTTTGSTATEEAAPTEEEASSGESGEGEEAEGGEAKPEASAPPLKVSAKSLPKLGSVLVNSEGKTLYVFAPDKDKEVTCVKECAAVWPPLKLEEGQKVVASGQAKSSLFGSDPSPEGGEVVTYGGWPLYTYVADTEAGKATGQNINLNGGYWYVISPAGKVIK